MDTIRVHPYHKVDVNALKIDDVEITATATELNTMAGITSTTAELNAGVLGGVTSMSTATTAVGTTAVQVQLVFKDADGVIMAVPTSGLLYMSEVESGLSMAAADTSLTVLTNGVITNLITHSLSHFITDATGKLGITITAASDDYWIVIVLPNGKLLISDVCVVAS